jgi:SET domain
MSLFGAGSAYAVLWLVDWIDEELENYGGIGGTTISRSVDNLRGLYATRNYEPGECILAFPTSLCLALHESFEFKAEGSKEEYDGDRRGIREGGLALRKLLSDHAQECFTTSTYHWITYLKSLPTENLQFDATPDLWDEDVICQLEVPHIVEQMLKRREQTKSQDYDDETPSLAFATWLVRSRAFTFSQVRGKNLVPLGETGCEVFMQTRTVLIPYLDMLNHAPSSKCNSILEFNGKPASVLDSIGDDNEHCFALVATKPIVAGDELTLSYGSGLNCLDLITTYGFWLRDNPEDAFLDLSHVKWSTSLLEDEEELASLLENGGVSDNDRRRRDRRAMLELRIHLKSMAALSGA